MRFFPWILLISLSATPVSASNPEVPSSLLTSLDGLLLDFNPPGKKILPAARIKINPDAFTTLYGSSEIPEPELNAIEIVLVPPEDWIPAENPKSGYFAPEFEFRSKSVAAKAIKGTSELIATYRKAIAYAWKTKFSKKISFKEAFQIAQNVYAEDIEVYTIIVGAGFEPKEERNAVFESFKSIFARDPRVEFHPSKRYDFYLRSKDKKIVKGVNLGTDAYVIEVRAEPMTNPEMKALKDEFQGVVFDFLASKGWNPPTWVSGGHANVWGQSVFGFDPAKFYRRLLNFMVDYSNFDFSMGTFLYDPGNSPANRIDMENYQSAIEEIRQEIDRKNYASALDKMKVFFSKANEIHIVTDASSADLETEEGLRKHAIRVEFRGFRAQRNFEQFQMISEILEARAKFVGERFDDRWIAIERGPIHRGVINRSGFNRYLRQSGLKPRNYASLLFSAYNPCNIVASVERRLKLGKILDFK